MTVQDMHGTPVLVYPPDGPLVRTERDAADLIGDAFGHQATWVALPASRLPDDFFQLSTRLAGEILQKFVNYGLGLAIVGDVSRHTAASATLRAFVHETNRGRHAWFVADLDDLRTRLAPNPSS